MPSAVFIRRAVVADAPAIAALADELRAVLGDPLGQFTPEAIVRDGFGPQPEFDVLLAVEGDAALGYALFYEVYEPTFAARGLYLADLCVTAKARGRGIGRALLDAVTAEAAERNRVYVWWLAAPTNTAAAAFYDAIKPDVVSPTISRVRLVRTQGRPT